MTKEMLISYYHNDRCIKKDKIKAFDCINCLEKFKKVVMNFVQQGLSYILLEDYKNDEWAKTRKESE